MLPFLQIGRERWPPAPCTGLRPSEDGAVHPISGRPSATDRGVRGEVRIGFCDAPLTGLAEHGALVSTLRPEKAGVLWIRVWVEKTSPLELRARITRANDLDRRDQVVSTASTTDEIEEVVGSWLHLFVDGRTG